MVADPLDRMGKAEERQTLKASLSWATGGQAPACSQEHVHELGRSRARPQEVDRSAAQAVLCGHREFRPRHIRDEAVTAVERRTWRKEEVANEEIGTELRVGQPFRTQRR